MRRIIGQCNQNTFISVEHLVSVIENPDQLDVKTLTKSQMLAFGFMGAALSKGISWEVMRKAVREILFWGEDAEKVTNIEIRLVRNMTPEVKRFKELWG